MPVSTTTALLRSPGRACSLCVPAACVDHEPELASCADSRSTVPSRVLPAGNTGLPALTRTLTHQRPFCFSNSIPISSHRRTSMNTAATIAPCTAASPHAIIVHKMVTSMAAGPVRRRTPPNRSQSVFTQMLCGSAVGSPHFEHGGPVVTGSGRSSDGSRPMNRSSSARRRRDASRLVIGREPGRIELAHTRITARVPHLKVRPRCKSFAFPLR